MGVEFLADAEAYAYAEVLQANMLSMRPNFYPALPVTWYRVGIHCMLGEDLGLDGWTAQPRHS